MSVKCTICGGEIPHSLIQWCSDKSGTPEEIWSKGYTRANYENLMDEIRANYHSDPVDVHRAANTRLYLWSDGDGGGEYPVCWTCAGKAKRKCYGCGEIFTGQMEHYDKPWQYISLFNDITFDYGYGEFDWFFCNESHCIDYQAFLNSLYKYPGYTKAIQKAIEMFRSGDVEGARLYITTQLVQYNISEFKKARCKVMK